MKKIIFSLLFLGCCFISNAQDLPKIGDELIINDPNAQTYQHIAFPKLNILNKRGVVANYKSVYGNHVIVDEIITKDDGSMYVILKKKDDTKFFGYLNTVKANYTKSIASKELSVAK